MCVYMYIPSLLSLPSSCFTHGNVYIYMSMLLSQLVLPSPSPAMSTSPVLYVCVPIPFLQISQPHFSRFYIDALIYDICFSVSDLLHSV